MKIFIAWISAILICICNLSYTDTNLNIPKMIGFLSKSDNVHWVNHEPRILEVPINKDLEFEIYGLNLLAIQFIVFTTTPLNWTDNCDAVRTTKSFTMDAKNDNFGTVSVRLESVQKGKSRYYFCTKLKESSRKLFVNMSGWFFQSAQDNLSFHSYEKVPMMPLWLQIILIALLCMLSGLFSGLNLGLMSLDMTELKIIEKAGSPSEKRYAKIIRPVRKRGNFLLCTLLLGNVLVNNTLTILLDDLTGSGVLAVVFSTVGIVLLGEIIPQAICSRHGLCIGAKTILITKIFMVLTGLVSYPISKLLDVILGKELGQVYSREKLEILVKEQQLYGCVVKDEAQIISGALTLTTTTVRDIMTPLNDVFMISYSAVLDFDTMNEIVRNGFTRVPVYDQDRSNIRAVLNVKDLAFIDPDDKIPVATVCSFYNRSILIVSDTTILRTMLEDFRQGKAHMAFVEKLENECEGDPYRVMIGLVTLEDVIEEIIQAEIMDETDVITDNVKKQRRMIRNQDFSVFNIPEAGKYARLSPQLKVAALRHLASNVEYFGEEFITYQVLQSLLNANIVVEHSFKSGDEASRNVIYETGKDANYAVLILQGKANVVVSSEKLLFEAGPFVMFGEILFKKVLDSIPTNEFLVNVKHNIGTVLTEMTKSCTFIPDYTVTAVSNLQYLKFTAKHYLFARMLSVWQTAGFTALTSNKISVDQSTMVISPDSQATAAMLRSKKSLITANLQMMHDFYQTEWEKHVERNLDDDTPINVKADCERTNDLEVFPLISANKHSDPSGKVSFSGDLSPNHSKSITELTTMSNDPTLKCYCSH